MALEKQKLQERYSATSQEIEKDKTTDVTFKISNHSGMIASYLYYGIYEPYKKLLSRNKIISFLVSFSGICILLFFLLALTGKIWGVQRVYGQLYFQWFAIVVGILLFTILAVEKTPLNRFLSSIPLRALGIVSFSFYLFHPLVFNILRKALPNYCGYSIAGLPMFIITVLVSYCVSCMTYTYIERPFLR